MADNQFRFEIDGFTPMTLSMQRLQEYLPSLVEIFGSEDDVHLLHVDEGSAIPCIYPKQRVMGRVQRRVLGLKTGHGSRKAYRAMAAINELLADDKTFAVLRAPAWGIELDFPGIKEAKDPIVGPVTEPTELQGELFQVGGRDETISVYLRHEGEIYICTATREQGRDISEHLFRQIRVRGLGRWLRKETGKWKLISLMLEEFKALETIGLSKAVENLRSLGRGFTVPPGLLPLDLNDED